MEKYGHLDTSYRAAGKEDGLRALCRDFYTLMDTQAEAKHIRQMHQESLEVMIDKLTLFLSMWLGGPRRYFETYSKLGMPQAHEHLIINESERDAWLFCMDIAIDRQPYALSFKEYLKKQFRFPANLIMKTSKS